MPWGSTGPWKLDFFDDFDGPANSAPNPAIWNYWHTNEMRRAARNRAENTYLDGAGNLVIRTTTANIGYGAELSAGGLVTKRHDFGPEEFLECSMAPSGWSAFWSQTNGGMNGTKAAPDPADGAEYDILEQYGGDSRPIQHNIHWGGYGSNHTTTGYDISGVANKFAQNVYGFERSVSGGYTKFYVNGVLDYTFTGIVSTRTDHELRLTAETEGDITSALAKVAYCARWTRP